MIFSMLRRVPSLAFTAIIIAGCATTQSEDDSLTIATSSLPDLKEVASEKLSGLIDYNYKGATYKAEWLVCKLPKSTGTLLVMHRDRAGYDKATFCDGWIAQTFLASGFDVVAVNRPGFASSTGVADFAGKQSLAAIHAGLAAGIKAGGIKQASGIWGYSSGATAAALVSKEMEGLKFLILGGGIYDLEETLSKTQDSYIKKDIGVIKNTGGDEALEERSIAFDVSGMPKRIALYHGKQDKTVEPGQAESFRDSLLSGEYQATLQVIDGVSHEIPVRTHQNILQVLVRSVN